MAQLFHHFDAQDIQVYVLKPYEGSIRCGLYPTSASLIVATEGMPF